MFLDQVVLKNKRFTLTAGDRDFDIAYAQHKLAGLTTWYARTEIAGDAFAKIAGLPDVQDLSVLIEKSVDAWFVW